METAESLRRRIHTAQEIHAVVRAMKAFSSVSIHQHERAVSALGHYVHTIELGFRVLQGAEGGLLVDEPVPPGRPVGAVVFGSDQGLCGPFDRSIAEFATDWLDREAGHASELLVTVVGLRAASELDARGVGIDPVGRVPGSVEAIVGRVHDLLLGIDGWRTERGVARVVLLHHRPGEGRTHHPVATQLIPLDVEHLRAQARHPWPTRVVPMTTLHGPELLAGLTRQLLFASLYRAFAESLASEHAARLAAMQGAERTIEDRLEHLGHAYHRVRQATITEELLDVTAGAEALAPSADGAAMAQV